MEFCGMKREIDRKCLNHARVHANAQSFDRCEGGSSNPKESKVVVVLMAIDGSRWLPPRSVTGPGSFLICNG